MARMSTLVARPAAALAELRDVPLGTLHVDSLKLVVYDWYMPGAALEVIGTMRLALTPPRAGSRPPAPRPPAP